MGSKQRVGRPICYVDFQLKFSASRPSISASIIFICSTIAKKNVIRNVFSQKGFCLCKYYLQRRWAERTTSSRVCEHIQGIIYSTGAMKNQKITLSSPFKELSEREWQSRHASKHKTLRQHPIKCCIPEEDSGMQHQRTIRDFCHWKKKADFWEGGTIFLSLLHTQYSDNRYGG